MKQLKNYNFESFEMFYLKSYAGLKLGRARYNGLEILKSRKIQMLISHQVWEINFKEQVFRKVSCIFFAYDIFMVLVKVTLKLTIN